MAKLVDVARAADVSVATVSRALNHHSNVNPVLAARIHVAAQSLGYRPNAVARNLRRQGTQVWALIITDINNPFYPAVARGVEDVAQQSGYSVLLCNSDEDRAKEARYLDVAEQERVAGVILAPRNTDTDVSRLRASAIPLVTVDRGLDQPVDTVRSDSQTGAARSTEHLLARGWQRPACITGPADTETAEQRHIGYAKVVKKHKLPNIVQHVPFHIAGGRQAVAELFDGPEPPDSLFVANSLLALGVLEALQQRKIKLGRDIGLITFDDAPWTPLIDPPISVVTQPAYEIGAEAARLLVGRIRGEISPEPTSVVLNTELIIRESCHRRPPRRSR